MIGKIRHKKILIRVQCYQWNDGKIALELPKLETFMDPNSIVLINPDPNTPEVTHVVLHGAHILIDEKPIDFYERICPLLGSEVDQTFTEDE